MDQVSARVQLTLDDAKARAGRIIDAAQAEADDYSSSSAAEVDDQIRRRIERLRATREDLIDKLLRVESSLRILAGEIASIGDRADLSAGEEGRV